MHDAAGVQVEERRRDVVHHGRRRPLIEAHTLRDGVEQVPALRNMGIGSGRRVGSEREDDVCQTTPPPPQRMRRRPRCGVPHCFLGARGEGVLNEYEKNNEGTLDEFPSISTL